MARVPSLAKFQWAAYPAFWAVIKRWAALFASCAIKLLCPLAFDMFVFQSAFLLAFLPSFFSPQFDEMITALHCTVLLLRG
jgi:hypothetical protein